MFFTYLFTLVNEKLMKKNNYSDVKSVLSVPSNFNDNDRKIIMQIGNNVGFNIIRLINEPTAAAFAYGVNNDDERNILIFDIVYKCVSNLPSTT